MRTQLPARQYLRPHYKAALVSIEDFKQYTQVVVCAGGEVLSECSQHSSLVMVEDYAPALGGILARLL